MNQLPLTPNAGSTTPEDRAAEAARRARQLISAEQAAAQEQPQLGGLADDSIYAGDDLPQREKKGKADKKEQTELSGRARGPLALRSPATMEPRLNPNPNARARWTRMMIIRQIRRRGRLTREMRIARSERSHTSKSRFFKTSIKKLSPLARQIAGKPIDEAILQMRFSKKKAAKEVLKHLVQARNEAIVIRGMGISRPVTTIKQRRTNIKDVETLVKTAIQERQGKTLRNPLDRTAYDQAIRELEAKHKTQAAPEQSTYITDPSSTPPLPTQLPMKALKPGIAPNATDIYVAQAWVNRGPYGREGSPRARGRMDVLRPPYTGVSVMLKEEKTRTREKMEKEIRSVRKRMKGNLWQQLPDRPVTRQSQYVLW